MQNQQQSEEKKEQTALDKVKERKTFAGLKQSEIRDVLESFKPSIVQALPKHLTAERMIQMASCQIVKNPSIAECTASSLIGAVMQASILGFEPVDSLGECYFVPYNRNIGTKTEKKYIKEVQFQIGYRGYVALSRRSNELIMLYAEVVRQGDHFDYEFGLDPKLVHKPEPGASGAMTHVYSVAKYKNGGHNFIVLTRAFVERLRRRNPMQGEYPTGAWGTDYETMSKAKAIKQLSKYLPLSVEFKHALLADEGIIDTDAFTNNNAGIKPEAIKYPEEPMDISQFQKYDKPEPISEPVVKTEPKKPEVISETVLPEAEKPQPETQIKAADITKVHPNRTKGTLFDENTNSQSK